MELPIESAMTQSVLKANRSKSQNSDLDKRVPVISTAAAVSHAEVTALTEKDGSYWTLIS